jgi:hypothetical protein
VGGFGGELYVSTSRLERVYSTGAIQSDDVNSAGALIGKSYYEVGLNKSFSSSLINQVIATRLIGDGPEPDADASSSRIFTATEFGSKTLAELGYSDVLWRKETGEAPVLKWYPSKSMITLSGTTDATSGKVYVYGGGKQIGTVDVNGTNFSVKLNKEDVKDLAELLFVVDGQKGRDVAAQNLLTSFDSRNPLTNLTLTQNVWRANGSWSKLSDVFASWNEAKGNLNINGLTTLTSNDGAWSVQQGVSVDIRSSATFNVDVALSVSGALRIASDADLAVSKALSSTLANRADALVLVAGADDGAGTSTGGDVTLANGGALSIDQTSGMRIYSGSLTGTTGFDAMIAAGKRRYNSNEGTSNFTKALDATGLSVIYREMVMASAGGEDIYNGNSGRSLTVNGEAFGLNASQNGEAKTLRNAGRYNVTSDDAKALGITVSDGTFVIKQREITISGITAQNKTYNGNDNATLVYTGVTFDGKLADDTLTLTATGKFSDKNASDTAKTVTITGLTLGGTDAGNYVLKGTGQQTEAQAHINRATLTVVGVGAVNRNYDGSTSVTISGNGYGVDGIIPGDSVTIIPRGSIDSKDAGNGKKVTVYGDVMGRDSSNYDIVYPTGVTVDIYKAPIIITGIQANHKSYDGKTDASFDVSQVTFGGKIGNDQLGVTIGGRFDDANAGSNKTVRITSRVLTGDDAGNYRVATTGHQDQASADISAVPLRVTVSDMSLDKEGLPYAGPYEVAYLGFVNGEGPNVLRGALRFSGPGTSATEEGEYRVSASGLAADNYVISYADGTLRLGRRVVQEAREIARLPVMPVRRFVETVPVVPLCQSTLIVGTSAPGDEARRFSLIGSPICGGP